MAVRYADDRIATVLTDWVVQPGKGNRWNEFRVNYVRKTNHIPGGKRTIKDPEILTLQEAPSLENRERRTCARSGIGSLPELCPLSVSIRMILVHAPYSTPCCHWSKPRPSSAVQGPGSSPLCGRRFCARSAFLATTFWIVVPLPIGRVEKDRLSVGDNEAVLATKDVSDTRIVSAPIVFLLQRSVRFSA